MKRDAVISECGRYRYSLTRDWDERLGRVVWVLLNPSVADALRDDMTVTKCCEYARMWGFGGIEIVNLMAWRSSTPGALRRQRDPIGPANDDYLVQALRSTERVVVGWGGSIRRACLSLDQVDQLEEALRVVADVCDVELLCLGTTREGHPLHPSRTSYELQLVPWAA